MLLETFATDDIFSISEFNVYQFFIFAENLVSKMSNSKALLSKKKLKVFVQLHNIYYILTTSEYKERAEVFLKFAKWSSLHQQHINKEYLWVRIPACNIDIFDERGSITCLIELSYLCVFVVLFLSLTEMQLKKKTQNII